MFQDIFNKILIQQKLTDAQTQLVDRYLTQYELDWGPMFKQERTYYPLNKSTLSDIKVPDSLLQQVENAGYYITNYRQGIAMKKTKPGQKKDLRQIKLGKILAKLKRQDLLKQFNERLETSRKEIGNLLICITHNPYDVAGMSTDRNWTSCMDLAKGCHKETALYQVTFGGMCAYLIKENDKEIEQPLARIAIKRLEAIKGNDFIFLSEKVIYGDTALGKELEFDKTVQELLDQSNEQTAHDSKYFDMQQVYDDELEDRTEDEQGNYRDPEEHRLIWSDQDYDEELYLSKKRLETITFDELKALYLKQLPISKLEFLLNKFHNELKQSPASNLTFIIQIPKLLEKYHDCIDWKSASHHYNFTVFMGKEENKKYVDLYADKLNWIYLLSHLKFIKDSDAQKLYAKTIEYYMNKHYQKIDWTRLILDDAFYHNKILKNYLTSSEFLSKIQDLIEPLAWKRLISYYHLPIKFIKEHLNDVSVADIVKSNPSNEVIELVENQLEDYHWDILLDNKLPRNSINPNSLTWEIQITDEMKQDAKQFILKYKDKINWSHLYQYYNVFSFAELKQLTQYIAWPVFIKFLLPHDLTLQLFEFLLQYISTEKILKYAIEKQVKIHLDVLEKYKDKLDKSLLMKWLDAYQSNISFWSQDRDYITIIKQHYLKDEIQKERDEKEQSIRQKIRQLEK